MSNQLQTIEKTLLSPETSSKLMLALGFDVQDHSATAEAKRYASSVLAEIQKSMSDKNRDLSVCAPASIVQTMIDAARMRVMIDGRQHAHIVKYGNNATLQMGYRGFLYKIKEVYPDADFVIEPVYQGDTVKIWDENGVQCYRHEKAGAFRNGDKDFIGILFAVTYTDNGRLIRKVTDVSKARIDRARKAAKQDFIWASDYIEKAKAAAIKAACKHMFASIQALQDMIRYDNEKHFDVDKDVIDVKAGSIVENLNQKIAPQSNQTTAAPTPSDVIDVDVVDDVQPEQPTQSNDAPDAIKKKAEQIKSAIKAETTEQGMFDLFDVDYKPDLEEIKKASPSAYDYLVRLKDLRLEDIRGGNA